MQTCIATTDAGALVWSSANECGLSTIVEVGKALPAIRDAKRVSAARPPWRPL